MPFERADPIITVDQSDIDDPELIALIDALDAELDPLYPDESQHGYDREKLKARSVTMFIARLDGLARACGGVEINGDEAEVKRMYVHPAARSIGMGQRILAAIEQHARSSGASIIRLETGIHQSAAIRLYKASGYTEIGPFGTYKLDPMSLFMEKRLG